MREDLYTMINENDKLKVRCEKLVSLIEVMFMSFMTGILVGGGLSDQDAAATAAEVWKDRDVREEMFRILSDETGETDETNG